MQPYTRFQNSISPFLIEFLWKCIAELEEEFAWYLRLKNRNIVGSFLNKRGKGELARDNWVHGEWKFRRTFKPFLSPFLVDENRTFENYVSGIHASISLSLWRGRSFEGYRIYSNIFYFGDKVSLLVTYISHIFLSSLFVSDFKRPKKLSTIRLKVFLVSFNG